MAYCHARPGPRCENAVVNPTASIEAGQTSHVLPTFSMPTNPPARLVPSPRKDRPHAPHLRAAGIVQLFFAVLQSDSYKLVHLNRIESRPVGGAPAVYEPVSGIKHSQRCQQDYRQPFQKHSHGLSSPPMTWKSRN